MKNFLKEFLKVGVLSLALVAIQAFAVAEPFQPFPEGNVPAPLNVGVQGQSKAGGLILNTGGASKGLIVDQGNVGIGTTNPGQKLDVVGYVRGTTGLCIGGPSGGNCISSWPSLSVSGQNLSISGGNSVTLPNNNTDNQTLSIGGQNLSISGGNTVTLPAGITDVVLITGCGQSPNEAECPAGYIDKGHFNTGNCGSTGSDLVYHSLCVKK